MHYECVYMCVYIQPVYILQLKQMTIWVLCLPNLGSPLNVIHTLAGHLSAGPNESRPEDLYPCLPIEIPWELLKPLNTRANPELVRVRMRPMCWHLKSTSPAVKISSGSQSQLVLNITMVPRL